MIHHKPLLQSVTLVLFLLLSGCASSPKVFSDFDARYDFTKNQTFSWVEDYPMIRAGSYPVSAIAETRMTNAIKEVLVSKGYSFVESPESSDLAILYTMGARDEIKFVERSSPYFRHRADWGWGAYHFPYFVHYPFGRSYADFEYPKIYTRGTIAIDIFETNTKLPIWHSKASKRLSRRELDSHAENALEIATALLQHFPLVGCEVEITPECQPFNSIDK